jgi:LysM repeat protein
MNGTRLFFIFTVGVLLSSLVAQPVWSKDSKDISLISKKERNEQAALEKALEAQGLKFDDLEKLSSTGKSKEAIDQLSKVLKKKLLEPEQEIIREYRQTLRTRILIGSITKPLPTQNYTVQKGDSLLKIEKSKQNTIAVLEQLNPELSYPWVHPEEILKTVPWKCSVEVDVQKKKLMVRVNDKKIKTYPIATGRKESPTPIGTFRIVNKIKHPIWYGKGVIAKPGDAANILGTRWLGFDRKGYGIHGTTEPESVGQATSSGCIRMKNTDVEELYGLVPIGAFVTIVQSGSQNANA